MDLEDQYDKIYRYCYFKLGHRQMAEDVTQETFLRFLESRDYCERGKKLQFLYTLAELADEAPENQVLMSIAVKTALSQLAEEEQELLLLRYVNELTVSEICGLLQVSRFAVYRKIQKALKRLRALLDREDFG